MIIFFFLINKGADLGLGVSEHTPSTSAPELKPSESAPSTRVQPETTLVQAEVTVEVTPVGGLGEAERVEVSAAADKGVMAEMIKTPPG